ncbi:MAG: response regulator transcription factor [Chloroflexota bacterium]
MIRVILADDHPLIRQSIRSVLEKADDIEIVGEAVDGQEAVELAQRLTPDVIVLDISMPRLDGAHAVEKIRAAAPATQVVILSGYDDKSLALMVLQKGARGYVLKDNIKPELLLAIRAASKKETYLSTAMPSSILEGL